MCELVSVNVIIKSASKHSLFQKTDI